MQKILVRIVLFLGIPFLLILGSYAITDPFNTLYPFSLKKPSSPNREYQTFELFKRNYQRERYNSFIFGSSRCSAINSYHWKSYLPDSSRQFLFQSWVETLTGITQKINYLDKKKCEIKNVLILFDIPGSFSPKQELTETISIKHYELSNKPKLYYHTNQFLSYMKPSVIYNSIKSYINFKEEIPSYDTISNDWNANNKFIKTQPLPDSTLNKEKFILFSEKVSVPLITQQFEKQLRFIKQILIKNKTNYKIIITPAYQKVKINNKDLFILQKIFDKKNIYDYTGNNEISTDKYNFFDINHFDSNIGWKIIDDIYKEPK